MGQEAFKNKLNSIGTKKIKLLAVKRFNRSRIKLKGYFTQMALTFQYKGHRIAMPPDAVAYAGIFLIGKALEWFKLYLIEYQTNGATITNLEMK